MKKKQRDSGGANDWLGTYSDMVTLLLCFFILLYSMATVDSEKWAQLVKSFSRSTNGSTAAIVFAPNGTGDDMGTNKGDGASFDDIATGGPTDGTSSGADSNSSGAASGVTDIQNSSPENFDQLYSYLEAFVNENGMQGSVELVQNGDNSVFIRFQDNIFFAPDSDVLKQESKPVLDFLGKCLKGIEDQLMLVRINGHTADVGYTDYPISDRRLSSNRADSVAIYLEDNYKIDGAKLLAMGYGKWFPVSDNGTPTGRAENRRVDMMIMSNANVSAEDTEMYEYLQGLTDVETVVEGINHGLAVNPDGTPNPNGASSKAEQPKENVPVESAPADK